FGVGSIQAGFILKEVAVDATGAITTQESLIKETYVYGAVTGQLSFGGHSDGKGGTQGGFGVGLNFAVSELGPLQMFVYSNVKIVLEPISGLAITELRGGVRFNTNLEDLQVRPPIGTSAGSVVEFIDPNDGTDTDYRVTLETTGNNLVVGDEFRIINSTTEFLSGEANFVVTAVDGDDITYEVEEDPGAYGGADIKKMTISDPEDLRDPGFASTKDLSLGDWEAQLDQAVVNQANVDGNVWDVLFDNAVLEVGATVSFDPRISDKIISFDADLLFDFEGRFLVTGKMNLASNLISIPAKLYTDFSDISTGAVRFLFLADLPEVEQNTFGIEPLLVLSGAVTFETLIGGVPATVDAITGLPAGVGMDVTAADVTDLSGTGDGPWDVTYTLDLPTAAPSDSLSVGDSVILVNNDPVTFDGTYIVRSIDDANDTFTMRIGTEVIDGQLDVDLDNDIDTDDDGTYLGIPVIDGSLDINRDGTIDADDGGEIFNVVAGVVVGVAIIDGMVDFDEDENVTADPDDDGVLGEGPGTLTTGGQAANLDDLGDGFRISLAGGIDVNIPSVTTITLEGSAQLDFAIGDADARIDFSFDASLSETNVGTIGQADGAFHVTIDTAGAGNVEIWGAAILTTDFGFLEPVGLFAAAEGLLRINTSGEEKPDEELMDVNGNTVSVALPANSFALRLDGDVDFRIQGTSVFQISGIFVLDFSNEQGFNVAIFAEDFSGDPGPASLRLGPEDATLIEFEVRGFLAIRNDGFAMDLGLSVDASLPLDLASISATAVLVVNTTGDVIEFDIPGGATDPNRPTGLSMTIPAAAPADPSAILTGPAPGDTGGISLQDLIDGSPSWTEGAAGAYGVVFLEGSMDLLTVLAFDISGYVLLSESVVSLAADFNAEGDFLGLASASVSGSVFFSSEGEFEVGVDGDVQLGPDRLNINGSAGLTISYLDENGKASGGTGSKVLDIYGDLNVGLTIDIDPFDRVNITGLSLSVAYNSGYGEITVGVTYPEPFWDEACTDLGPLGEVCIPFPNFREATNTFVVGALKVVTPPPPVLGQVDGSGVLTVNVGDATARNLRSLLVDEINEDVTIGAIGPVSGGVQTITLSMFGVTQEFAGVTEILISDMADGDDRVILDVDVPATISGGAGSDSLTYRGTGLAILNGDDGQDSLAIYGTPSSSSELYGGADNDTLYNASNVDVALYGDGGNDDITGGTGDDTTLEGGAGADTIRGGGGVDTMTGGAGADLLVEDVADLELFETAIGGGGGDRVMIVGSSAADDLRVTIDAFDVVKISSYSGGSVVGSITLDAGGVEAINLAGLGGADDFSLSGALELGGVTSGVTIDVGSDSAPDEVNVTLGSGADVLEIDSTNAGIQGVWATHFTFAVQSAEASDGDTLSVYALGGMDELTVGEGSDGRRVKDSLDVVLDGGDDDDTLRTVYGNVDLIGGAGTNDKAIISSDPNTTGKPDITLVSDKVAVYRNGSLEHLVSYSEVEDVAIELGDASTGNDLTVQNTLGHPLLITGSGGADDVVVESVDASGGIEINLNAGANTVTLGKNGSLALLANSVDVNGGTGADTLIYDNSNDPTGRTPSVGSTSVSGLPLSSTVAFDAAVEAIRLELGLDADQVTIDGLTRR
ncbi:MAG: calcium-binding protein, partial [Pirellulales bacterium]